MAVLGFLSELAMIPAERVLSRGSGGGGRDRTLRAMKSGHTMSLKVISTSVERGNHVSKACDFFPKLFDLRGVCGAHNGRHRGD